MYNMIGFNTLLYKELLRFWKVAFQTICAPVMSALLYMTIFSHTINSQIRMYEKFSYISFLIPGLIMMSILQNSFSNSSSSLIQSKITGNLIFILLAPLAHWELFAAYVIAAAVRGLIVGLFVFIVTAFFVPINFFSIFYISIFALLGSASLGTLGLIAGIWAEKFDQLAAFQNLLIMPMTFLSGVFYSTQSLPLLARTISRFNPFFYIIDGFRYGFFGISDVTPQNSLGIIALFFTILATIAVRMLAVGYKLRY